MKFKVDTSELNEALSVVSHALSARSTLPILEGILIESGEKGLNMTCTDGAMTITTTIPAEIGEEGSAVMPGRLFMEVARKQTAGELSVSIGVNSIATIRCGGSRTTLSVKASNQFPRLPQIEADQRVTLPQALLRDMITKTSFAVSTEEARKILTGCLLEIENGEARLVALDGYRMAVVMAPIEDSALSLRAVIPGKLLQEAAKIISGNDKDEVQLTFSKTQLLIEFSGIRVFSTLLEGEFISYRNIIPAETKYVARVIDRGQMSLCVERASLMAREGKTNLIKLHISPDMMIITSNAEMGDVYEEVPIEAQGGELDIAFNVRYISDVLRAIDDETFVMKFNSPVSPCIITSESGAGYTYMVLPVRVNA